MMKTLIFALSLVSTSISMVSVPAHAAGKKKPTPAPGTCKPEDYLVSASPTRKVYLRPVATKAFDLPNGARVDMTADLNSIFTTAVASTETFSPTDTGGAGAPSSMDDLCGHHIEVRAAVTTLQMNAFELGLNFGYTPSGETATGTGVTGQANVRLGTVAMDFSVWECQQGTCSAVAASTSNALTTGVSMSVKLDFSKINGSADLVFNTPLGDALRKIMNDGMKQLSKSSRLSELSWMARVREYLPETGILFFDQGLQSRLTPNQAFVVYAVSESTGVCEVFRPVAEIHTTSVNAVSSTALVDKSLDARGIRDGDVVMVKAIAAPKAN